FQRPFNVVDPVDPARNVSSAVSSTALHTFMLAAWEFLAAPDPRFFFPKPRRECSATEAMAWFGTRGTTPAVVEVERPDLIDDVLFSQVKKAHSSLRDALSEAGFLVLSSDFLAGERVEMAFEVHPSELTPLMVRRGPPVSDANAARFREKWPRSFVDDDRLWAEVPRPDRTVEGVLLRGLADRGLGKDLATVAGDAIVHVGEGAASRTGVMSLLMDRRLPWTR
ncbi:MAG: hypothetical protein L0Z54_05165, partial [Thermoplasmata archaeon]|nr:hypothetical protein [Thermoplasmata archaeon]